MVWLGGLHDCVVIMFTSWCALGFAMTCSSSSVVVLLVVCGLVVCFIALDLGVGFDVLWLVGCCLSRVCWVLIRYCWQRCLVGYTLAGCVALC